MKSSRISTDQKDSASHKRNNQSEKPFCLQPQLKKRNEANGIISLKKSQSYQPSIFAAEIEIYGKKLFVDISAFVPDPRIYLDSSEKYQSKIIYIGSPEEGKIFSFEIDHNIGDHANSNVIFKNTRL